MDRKLDELLFALMQNMMLTVSGEKLAKDLGVSHSTLVRWIDKLRAAGIEIRGELFTGYRLVRLPDYSCHSSSGRGSGRGFLEEICTTSMTSIRRTCSLAG